jgi:hypothetical protein
MENTLTPFEGKNIRSLTHNGETYFSIVDIIGVLSDSPIPRNYWTKIKKGLLKESQLHPFWVQLKFQSTDGKFYQSDAANTEGVLRIIQSVPSPKAEPFKQWLAGLGKRELEEVADPERLTERQAELYKAKGYPEDWISRRVESIEARKRLTEEWQKRGVKEGEEYSLLTATIAKGTFGLSPSEHSQLKGLKKENLRDHMTPIELILTAFAEETTRLIAIKEDAQGFHENHDSATKGGSIAGEARKRVEKQLGERVVSPTNFLNLGQEKPNALENGKEE